MIKHSLFITLIIFQLTSISCARKPSVETRQTCQDQIKRAENLQKQQQGQLDASLNEVITNLIVAAKIHAQHSEQVKCIEKTGRALELLKDPNTIKDQKN